MMSLLTMMTNTTVLQEEPIEPVAAISVSDRFGNTVDKQVEVGQLLIVSGRDAQHAGVEGSLSWYVEPAVPSYIDSVGDVIVISTGLQPKTITITQIVSSLNGRHDFTRLSIRVGQAPNPPPIDPVDPVDPVDPPALKVLIIEETAERTYEFASIISSPQLRTWLKDNCSTTDGVPDFRIFDIDTAVERQPQWIKDGFKEPTELPWMYIPGRFSGPLPSTVDETLKVLEDARTYHQ
jgi:hypothetical protein